MSRDIPTDPPEPDDLLARAGDALRRATTTEGPSPEVVQRTLTALRTAADAPPVAPFWRKKRMFTLMKTAAALVAAVGGLFYLATPRPATAMSFAEVAAKLRDARTLAYREVVEIAGMPQPFSARVLYKEPALMRMELTGGGVVIMDQKRGKTLTLDPTSKTALVIDMTQPDGPKAKHTDDPTNWVEALRTLARKDGKPVGEKEIGGVKVQGFRVMEGNLATTVWADPEAKLPVTVEMTGKIADKAILVTLSDFQLDPPLDDQLFRLEPPPGYAVKSRDMKLLTPEGNVVRLLRLYSSKAGGKFPEKIDDGTALFKVIFQGKELNAAKPDEELMQAIESLAGVTAFRLVAKDNGYQADGVTLGDADKVVFWYKLPGAATYRAVFGDLHVADVTPDKIPAPRVHEH